MLERNSNYNWDNWMNLQIATPRLMQQPYLLLPSGHLKKIGLKEGQQNTERVKLVNLLIHRSTLW